MRFIILSFLVMYSNASIAFDADNLIPNITQGLSETASTMMMKVAKQTDQKPKSTNGYYMYDKDGNYKGVVSENVKCAFYNAYSSSNGIQVSYSQVNSVQLTCY